MRIKNQQGLTTFWGISIVLIEAVVVFFIFYILYFFWIENPTPTTNILIVKAFSRDVVSIPDEVADEGWLTYSNEYNGFSFKYPKEYQVVQDEIYYNDYAGTVLTLTYGNREDFYLNFFEVRSGEDIATAYTRLTAVDPSVYQQFEEKVSKQEALVYRYQRGSNDSDIIYFIGNGNIFESKFDKASAQILSTFIIK